MTTWTSWHTARVIQQLGEDPVEYSDGDATLDTVNNVISRQPLRGVATSTGRALNTVQGRSLLYRDFGFNPGSVQAVQLELSVQRFARIQDRQIQLWLGSEIGENLADLSAANFNQYGGSDGLGWAITPINPGVPEFGVIIDLQPHTKYPSADRPIIEWVRLRVSYL